MTILINVVLIYLVIGCTYLNLIILVCNLGICTKIDKATDNDGVGENFDNLINSVHRPSEYLILLTNVITWLPQVIVCIYLEFTDPDWLKKIFGNK